MQVKKEPEPLVDDSTSIKTSDEVGLDQVPATAASVDPITEEKLASEVPEDVSLNTPTSNPDDTAAEETKVPPQPPGDEADIAPPAPSSEAPAIDEGGGDLEGSVTEEAPPDSPFDSDNEVVDDEPVVPAEEGGEEVNDAPADAATTTTAAADVLASEALLVETQMEDVPAPPPAESAIESAATVESVGVAASASDEPMDTSKSADQGFRTEAVVNENGQNSLDSDQNKEMSAEDDLLTSTEATNMEEGDEQYKNIIAETQMDNIFN